MTRDEALAILEDIGDQYPGRFTLPPRAVKTWADALVGFNLLDAEAGRKLMAREMDPKDLIWPPSLPLLVRYILPFHRFRCRWVASKERSLELAREDGDQEMIAKAERRVAYCRDHARAMR